MRTSIPAPLISLIHTSAHFVHFDHPTSLFHFCTAVTHSLSPSTSTSSSSWKAEYLSPLWPWLCCCCWMSALLRRGIYICVRTPALLLSEGCTIVAWSVALWAEENINAQRPEWTAAVRLRFLEQVSLLEMLWSELFGSVCTGSGYNLKIPLPDSFFSPAWTYTSVPLWDGVCTHPSREARRLTMGDSMWRYYFGVFFLAFELDLCRPLILESIYWNTTNTK